MDHAKTWVTRLTAVGPWCMATSGINDFTMQCEPLMLYSCSGWWFGTFLFFHILGISWSQLTSSYFSGGVGIPPTSVDRFWKNVWFLIYQLYGYIMFLYIYTYVSNTYQTCFFFYFHVCYLYPYAPWCWYIYLQNWAIFGVNVGKYASTMEHMGYIPCHTRPTLVIFGTTNLGTRQYSTRWQVDRWEHPKKAPCFP